MSVFFLSIPFSVGIWTLSILAPLADFFMGLVDTGELKLIFKTIFHLSHSPDSLHNSFHEKISVFLKNY